MCVKMHNLSFSMLHGENIKFFHIWKVISRHTLVVYMYLKSRISQDLRKKLQESKSEFCECSP